MKEYKGIINNVLLNEYEEVLIISVEDDKLYRYVITNNDFVCDKELSYASYLEDCKNFIYEDDIDGYIDSLSISKLESTSGLCLNYKMHDKDFGTYRDYVNNISIYDDNGKKVIVVLVSLVKNGASYHKENGAKTSLETKLNKMVDSVSLAILKLHNVINNDSPFNTKREFIDSILVGLTNEFPEFTEALNDNAMFLADSGKSTIMIIDDDKMTCNLIKKIFDKNYEVIVANDGKQAIEILTDMENNFSNLKNLACEILRAQAVSFTTTSSPRGAHP